MTRKDNLLFIGIMLAAAAITACSSSEAEEPGPDNPTRPQINIVTRAENSNSATNQLQAGLYMQNRLGTYPEELLSIGNYIDNQLLTYGDGSWTSKAPLYWLNLFTPADFYVYAPRQEKVADARLLPVSVEADQRKEEAFIKSDFLWGTVQNQLPRADGFLLLLSHKLSRISIVVVGGAGFSDGELKDKDVSVAVEGTRISGTADIMTGSVSANNGPATDVLCHADGGLTYTAILIPQQVPFANLIQVDWLGNKYTLQNSFLLEPSRHYTLTVNLKKTQSGFDIGIDGWDIIEEDFGGTVGD